jgi:hypothetical protein
MGIDVYELEDGDLSLRRLSNIVHRLLLVPSSQISMEIGKVPDAARTWPDQNTWLLANIADQVAALDYHFLTANSEQGKGPKKPPEPFPRPTDPPKKPKPRLGASLPIGGPKKN